MSKRFETDSRSVDENDHNPAVLIVPVDNYNYESDEQQEDDSEIRPFLHVGVSTAASRTSSPSNIVQLSPSFDSASASSILAPPLPPPSSSTRSLSSPNNSTSSTTGTFTYRRRWFGTIFSWIMSMSRLRMKQIGIVTLILLGLLMRQHDHHQVNTSSSSSLHHYGSNRMKQPESFDINGPPVPLNDSETILTLLEKEADEQDATNIDGHTTTASRTTVNNNMNNKHHGRQSSTTQPSYPIIKDSDEAPLPLLSGSSTTSVHAAEALLCRKSVINFVINATDVKDECEGLKKAFDKTCSNNNNEEEEEDSAEDDESEASRPHPPRHRRQRQRRTLWQKTRHGDKIRLFLYQHWMWLKRIGDALSFYPSSQDHEKKDPTSAFFFSENAVTNAYQDGYTMNLVENDWDQLAFQHLLKSWALQRDQEYQYLYYPSYSEDESNVNGDNDEVYRILLKHNDAEQTGEVIKGASSNKTRINNNKQHQQTPPLSLDLPTSSEHVSDKMVSETLLLTQGDKLIEKAHNESLAKQLKTKEAAEDAHASAKAVADTNAAVTALLNDPTSIEARTCCASILSVYHENCSTDDNEQFSDSRLLLMLFVMAVCGMVKSLIRHFKILWLPEAAGCILVGVLSGYILMFFPHHDISFDGNWFLRIMVPPIVFEAALSIDKRSFNRHIVPIVIFSVIGTLIATVVTAYVLHRGTTALSRFCTPIPTVEALTFGALISSIDPIAVLSVLSNMGMTDTDTIYVLIFGESLLNDGVSIVLFQTLVHFLDDNLVIDSAAISAATVHFLVVAIGSLLIGVASGMMSTVYYWLFHGCQTPLVEVLMFMCWAMLPYYICDGIEWSGIVAAVANGFVMDLYIRGQVGADDQPLVDDSEDYTISRGGTEPPSSKERVRRRIFSQYGHLSAEARQHIGFVTEILATVLETAIFAYLGIFLFSHRYHWNFFHTVIAIFACCFSRALMIPSLSLVANWITRLQQSRAACRYAQGNKKSTPTSAYLAPNGPPGVVIDKRMQLVLWFAGLRGAMSFALVEHVPLYDSVSGEGTPLKPELKAMTSACILFTVFILGGYTYYMMEYLGLAPQAPGALHRRGGAANHNGSLNTYELASLIGKVDSGDEASFEHPPASSSRKDTVQGAVTTSGRQLAFRRQRQVPLTDAGSPNHNED